MKKKFYIWKDPSCAGQNIVWQEISGQEYNAMIRKPEKANRRFVILPGESESEDQTLYMEATEEQYQSWRRDTNAKDYRNRYRNLYTFVSMDAVLDDSGDGETILHDRIGDDAVHVEDTALHHVELDRLREGIQELTDEENAVIDLFFFHNSEELSEHKIARNLGVPRMTLRNRKEKILKKLEKSLVQNGVLVSNIGVEG